MSAQRPAPDNTASSFPEETALNQAYLPPLLLPRAKCPNVHPFQGLINLSRVRLNPKKNQYEVETDCEIDYFFKSASNG